jgi:hypothetical protein
MSDTVRRTRLWHPFANMAQVAGAEVVFARCEAGPSLLDAGGTPGRQLIVAREHAYHGMAGYGTSLGGIKGNYTGFGDLLPGVIRVPAHDVDAVARVFAKHEGEIAAFFGEPVIGAGGVRPPLGGLLARRLASVSHARRAPGRRRSDYGVRPPGTLVRLHALRDRAGPADRRQGHHLGLRAARAGGRRTACAGTLLARSGRDVPARVYARCGARWRTDVMRQQVAERSVALADHIS